ncbi:TRAP transporter small permease [Hoeflea sp. CAU 1731]
MAASAGVVLAFMALHIVADVGMKYVFHAPIVGTLEVVSHYYMIFVTFMPLAMIEWKRESIVVDVFYKTFPRWLRMASTAITFALVIGVYCALTYSSLLAALHATEIGEIAMGSAMTVIWPSRWALPIGFSCACIVMIWYLIVFLTRNEEWESLFDERAGSGEFPGA